MSDVSAEVLLVDRLRDGLDRLLPKRGFLREEEPLTVLWLKVYSDARRRIYHWLRESQWKRERVQMMHSLSHPRELILNVTVRIPLAESGEEVTVDGTTVAYLSGKPRGYHLPAAFLRCRGPRTVEKIVRDTEKALEWLRAYDTPQKCLRRLLSEDRNGVRVGTPEHRKAVEYLSRLSPPLGDGAGGRIAGNDSRRNSEWD